MTTRRVLLHCNAGGGYGMGHLMRSIALADEALFQGWQAALVGDVSDAAQTRAARLVPGLEIDPVAPRGLEASLRAHAATADLVHLDSYWDVPDLTGGAAVVSNMQDGPYGARPADLAIDANLGAETWFERPDVSSFHLAGVDAAVIRRQVLQQRDATSDTHERFRILVVMGGADPGGLTTHVAEALAVLPAAFDVTVIVAETAHDAIAAAFGGTAHDLTQLTFAEDLPALARAHDLVISAAGTSVWDFASMGVPMALICAVDNQRRGYRAAIDAGLAIPLGEPPHSDLSERMSAVYAVAHDPTWAAAQRDHLRSTVDGRGAWRIVSAWEQLVERPADRFGDSGELAARPAVAGDAQTLFDWRNDETTRLNSRSQEPLSWDGHVGWLERCLADPQRILLMVGDSAGDVATVRWDRRAEFDWEVSITVAPQHRGRRLGRAVLAAGERALDVPGPVRMLAGIHHDNAASRRLFRGAGYLPHQPADADGFEMLAKWRLPVR